MALAQYLGGNSNVQTLPYDPNTKPVYSNLPYNPNEKPVFSNLNTGQDNNIFRASNQGSSPISSAINPGGNNNMTGIRNYLTSNGYNNNDIGYNNGYVTLKGNNFMQATPQAQDDLQNGLYQGSTYASPTALQSALGAYHNTFGNPTTDLTSTTGRTTALGNALNSQINQVNSQPFQFKQQQSPFSYDPNSDQAYQAALKAAQFNIGQSQGNTLGQLSAHGMGNSSYAATAAQQIANQGMNNVSQNILPQLIQQAYQRYQDQNINERENQKLNYGVGQDQFRNQGALAGQLQGINQQETQNQLGAAGLTGNLNGQETLEAQKLQAALSGKLANGDPTLTAALDRVNALGYVTKADAALLGVPEGTVSRAMQVAMSNMNYKNAQLGLRADANDIARTRAGNQSAHYGAMDNYYNARAGDAKNTQQSNSIAAEVYNHANEFQSPQDVEDYFKANGSYLAQHLGAKATDELKKSFMTPFNQDNKQSTSTYDRAFSAAQRDADWNGLSSADKNARIKQYQDMLINQ